MDPQIHDVLCAFQTKDQVCLDFESMKYAQAEILRPTHISVFQIKNSKKKERANLKGSWVLPPPVQVRSPKTLSNVEIYGLSVGYLDIRFRFAKGDNYITRLSPRSH
jgi:hypothetical protein